MNQSLNTINYKELVNPIFATGQATLEMLASTGNPDAKEYLTHLGIADAVKRVSGNNQEQNQIFSPEEGRALMMGVTLGIEARYAAVSRLLKESGCKNMLDIACGYTPRALMCQKEEINYLGFDLPAVVDKMEPLSHKVFPQQTRPLYISGDVTNEASLKKAADQFDGELFISSEGLMTYLNESELLQTIRGIRQLLLEHGGAWYTSDMEVQYDRITAAAINHPDVMERWKKIISSIKDDTDIYFFPIEFKSLYDKIVFFEKCGLMVERVPFFTEDTALNILHGFDPISQKRMKDLMKNFYIWKMTAIPDYDLPEYKASSIYHLEIRHHIKDNHLHMALEGRLDTLSAPELMKLMDELTQNHSITDLTMDLTGLDYMSSTGLRVLLMMAKRLGSDHILITNPNDIVREIFESTGFVNVITIQ